MKPQVAPQKLSVLLENYLSDSGYLAVCRENDLLRKWPEIVGAGVAEVTECSRVEDGVLYVRVSSAAWRQELSYLKHKILKKIHSQTGVMSLREIVFF